MDQSIVLYSTGCPKCSVLTKKLDAANIQYTVNTSVDDMRALGLKSAPTLSVNGNLLNFTEAVRWITDRISELTPSD